MSIEWFETHRGNVQRIEIQLYFENLLSKSSVDKNKLVFEIGSGSNFLKQYFFENKLLSSDVLFTPDISIQLDCHQIPFKDESFEQIIGIDVLHHLRNPHFAINELARCLKEDGKIILIEPYISIFSFPIYRIFHHEFTSYNLHLESQKDLLSGDPMDADNNIPTQIFTKKSNSAYLIKMLSYKYNLKFELIFSDFLSFFATGGLQRNRSFIKGYLYKFLLHLENFIPQFILKIIGSRMIIILKKSE